MKDILKSIILNIVDNREAVEIMEKERDNVVFYEIKILTTDMGKVIGKQGRIAKAIRTVIRSVAGKENKKVIIEFVEKE